MSLPSTDPRPGARPKATLFCPDCGHEGDAGGDWLVHETPRRVRTECPECRTVIDDRPRERGRPARLSSGTSRTSGVARTPVGVVVGLQRYVLGWWRRFGKRLTSARSPV
jgi:hypothetical protein